MSKLRGAKPETIEKRLKAFFYGRAGVGKTTAAIQFPTPYLIDTEKGATNDQYIDLLKKSGGVVFQTCDFNELVAEIKTLLMEKHEFKTLIIDPMTTLYNDLLEKCARKSGTDFGRHYKDAETKMKELINLLYRLDMNVIIVAHSKSEYGQKMELIGQTFDCFKKLDYMFDLVLEVQKRGKERVALIKKSRITAFPDDEVFPFSYAEVARRYDKKILERNAVPEKLATPGQIERANYLIGLYHEPEENIIKWLKKSEASCLEEVSEEKILKLISHLESKVNSSSQKDQEKIIEIPRAS